MPEIHLPGWPRRRPLAYSALALASLVIALGALCACEKKDREPATRQISIDRVVFFPGLLGDAHALIRLAEGGFVLVGGTSRGWVARTDSMGRLLWKYDDTNAYTRDGVVQQFTFNGVAALDDGSIHVCGSNDVTRQGALLTFSADGQLLEEKDVEPVEKSVDHGLAINRCLPWDGGLGFVGSGEDGARSYGWIGRYDRQGRRVLDIVDPDFGVRDVIEAADGGLILSRRYAYNATGLVHLGRDGRVLGKNLLLRTAGFQLLDPAEHADLVGAVAVDPDGAAAARFFDAQLREVGWVKLDQATDITRGRGFVYPDRSLALFGWSVRSLPSISHIKAGDSRGVGLELDPQVAKVTIDDAVGISPGRYVALSEKFSARGQFGVVLLWISVN